LRVIPTYRIVCIILTLVTCPLTISVAQVAVTNETAGGLHRADDQSDDETRVAATQPGVGVGLVVGIDGQLGASSSDIQNGVAYEGQLRYGFPFGLFVLGGIHVSKHDIDQVSPYYKLTDFFLEPRFVALRFSSRWAPFLSGRVSLLKEEVDQPGAQFTATGHSLGGGLGVYLRLAPQVALEGAFNVGVVKLNDYVFQGERAWYLCLEELDGETSLPESVVLCQGSSGGPQYNCYPPFFEFLGGSCTPPEIPYPDSGRSSKWFQARLGVQLSFASP